jgi:HSP20 family protein
MNLIKFKKDNDLFSNAFGSLFNSPFYTSRDTTSNFAPKVRISEDKDNFMLKLEIPGITKDDIKINIEDDVLSISGTKKQEKKTEETNLLMNELYYGEFSRSFNISKDIDTNKIEAEFKDGVLNVTLPKVEEAKQVKKEISVK